MPADLERLSDGALDWLVRNLDYFDPHAERARSAPHGKAKAALELALLCHCWARLDTGALESGADPRLDKATALLRTIWQRPDFPQLIAADPRYTAQYGLICAALAPDGIDQQPCRAALARLTDDDLSPRGKSGYQRLEWRYYADKAGARHTIEPYAELVGQNVLSSLPATVSPHGSPPHGTPERGSLPHGAPAQGTLPHGAPAQGTLPHGSSARETPPHGTPHDAAPVTVPEAYAVTHSSFYLSDFGRTRTGLSDDALAAAVELVHRMLAYCVRRDWWDLAAELVMSQVCLGVEPLHTPSGVAAVACLARAQRPDGAIPGRSPATSAAPAEPAGACFAKAYHTTLVTAFMSLLVSSARTS